MRGRLWGRDDIRMSQCNTTSVTSPQNYIYCDILSTKNSEKNYTFGADYLLFETVTMTLRHFCQHNNAKFKNNAIVTSLLLLNLKFNIRGSKGMVQVRDSSHSMLRKILW